MSTENKNLKTNEPEINELVDEQAEGVTGGTFPNSPMWTCSKCEFNHNPIHIPKCQRCGS